jgi:chromosome segregation ATPase
MVLAYGQLEEHYTALQQQENNKRDEIASIEVEIAKMQDTITALEEKYASVQNEINQLDDERKRLIADISILEKEIKVKDLNALRNMQATKNQELIDRKEECNRINSEITELTQSFEELSEELESKKKLKQDTIWSCENQISQKNTELATLEQQINERQSERTAIIEQANQAQSELTQLENWFRSVEATSYTDKIRSCTEGINRMKNAMSMLEKETGLESLSKADARVSLNELKKYFRDEIGDVEQKLKGYQRSYQIVLNSIENGGCVI